jgi:hypothetical protein
VSLRHLLRGPRAIVRASGFDVVRYFTLVSWEDVLTERETGFVLQADCIFVI